MSTEILKIENIEVDKIGLLSPTLITPTEIAFGIFYKQKQKKIPLLIQIPQLLFNNQKNNKIVVPIMSNTDAKTKKISNFFKGLDEYFILKIKDVLGQLKTNNNHKFSFVNYDEINYRGIVNEIINDDTDDDTFKNGLIVLILNNKTQVYNEDKELVKDLNFKPGCYLRTLLEFKTLTVKNNDIFVNINVHQMQIINEKIDQVELPVYSFGMSDDEGDSGNDEQCDAKIDIFNRVEYVNDVNEDIEQNNYEDDSGNENENGEYDCDAIISETTDDIGPVTLFK